MEEYLVAIQCLVYNHEKYLRQTLDGFLMQKTKFKFIALVHDDVSKDKSVDIIREYAERYPDIIIPLIETENQWSQKRIDHVMNEHLAYYNPKYVAICEGDDFWTDPYKLQKEVDILEGDFSLIACVTNCSLVDMNGNMLNAKCPTQIVKNNVEGRYNLRDFFQNNHQYPTMSVVYRNISIEKRDKMQEKLKNLFLQDWTLWIILHTMGDFYYLDEVTCAYRINPTSITHTQWVKNRVEKIKSSFDLLPRVADVLPEEYLDIAANLRNTDHLWAYLAKAYYQEKRYLGMLYALLGAIIKCPNVLWKNIIAHINQNQ